MVEIFECNINLYVLFGYVVVSLLVYSPNVPANLVVKDTKNPTSMMKMMIFRGNH